MWVRVAGFEKYEVDENGNVRSVDRCVFCRTPWGVESTRIKKGVVITAHKTPGGYPFVVLYKDRRRFTKMVHTLVYNNFIGPIYPGDVIKHKDGNLSNCNYRNLIRSNQSESIRKSNSGRLKGIERYKDTGRWMVRVSVAGKRRFFGIYNDKRSAYEAYYHRYLEIFGEEPFPKDLLEGLTPACPEPS